MKIHLLLASIVLLSTVLALPLASSAHGGDDASSTSQPMLHAPVEIGTNFSSSSQTNIGGGKILEEVKMNNHAIVDAENQRSIITVIILGILVLLIVALVWLNPGEQNKIVRIIQRLNYLTGAMVVSLLALITITGAIISLWYIPFPGLAYESIQAMADSPIVGYIRNLHYWASDMLLVLLVVHMTRVVLTKISDKKKLFAYWTGLVMFALVLTAMLLGTFMRSDQESYEAYAHFWVGATNYLPNIIANVALFIGVGDTALLRFFILHTIAIPIAILILIGVHAIYAMSFRRLLSQTGRYLQQRSVSAKRKFPQLKQIAISSGVLWGVAFLLATIPAPIFSEAYNGLEITKPPWYLLWIYGTENLWGMKAILFAPLIVVITLFFLPFLSRKSKRVDATMLIYGILGLIITGLSIYVLMGETTAHLTM